VTRSVPFAFQLGFQRVRQRHVVPIRAKRLPDVVVPTVVPASELVALRERERELYRAHFDLEGLLDIWKRREARNRE